MSTKNDEEPVVYKIPNNFINTGTILGGMIKTRNAFEAGAIAVAIGYPIIHLHLSFITTAVLLILLILPPGVVALVGVNDGPLSEFIFDFFSYLFSKKDIEADPIESEENSVKQKNKKQKRK